MKRGFSFLSLPLTGLSLTLIFFSMTGISDEGTPPWLTATPQPDDVYRYYVGRASSKNDESEAFTEAARRATEQAIRENFGFETEIRTQAFETAKDTLLAKTISDISRRVRFEDFEQKESFKSTENGEIKVWLLFRYKITSIEKEKKRLLSTPKDTIPDYQFSGNPLDAASGTLEVTSDPPGASVFLDRALLNFIKTPLRIYGQIAPGPHTLKIDHHTSETEERSFVFELGKVNSVQVKLKKAMGTLSIKSTPPNAKILINGKNYGTTPLDDIKLPAGIPCKLELLHDETERFAQEVVLSKNAPKELTLELPLKPSHVQITSIPEGAAFTLSGKKDYEGVTPSDWISIEPGGYSLKVEKPGYESAHENFSIKGGEKKLLPTLTLSDEKPKEPVRRDSAYVPPAYTSTSKANDHPYSGLILAVTLAGYSSTLSRLEQWSYGAGLFAEVKLTDHIGLFGEYLYKTTTKQQFNDGAMSSESQGGRVGIPFYSSPDRRHHSFFFSPEMMWLSTKVKIEPKERQASELDLSQSGYGASFGGMIVPKNNQGMFYRMGVHQFSDTSAYKGATMVTFSFGVLFGY